MRELEALQAECTAIDETLAAVPPDAWSRPGLGQWSVHELAVHLTRGMGRIAAYLDEPVDGPVDRDQVSYFRYDADKVAPGVAARATEEARALPAEQLAGAFADAWRASVERARAVPADRLIASPFGTMQLQEYVATRCVEAVVHHMDLRRALDRPVAPDADAATLVARLLEGLLEGPRPRNLGRDRFILVATGRLPHDDPRFPVLR